jgi:short subunit dehydrogenase-like uncharacterized protein
MDRWTGVSPPPAVCFLVGDPVEHDEVLGVAPDVHAELAVRVLVRATQLEVAVVAVLVLHAAVHAVGSLEVHQWHT